MPKPILMIHEFKREYLDLPLENYTLTFDDGLVSPLSYWNDINKIDTKKIFFIPTGAVDGGSIEGKPPETFMNLEQLKFLDSHGDVFLGGHSHNHADIRAEWNLTEMYKFVLQDTTTMCLWFKRNLGKKVEHFCYPYNYEHAIYQAVLRQEFGIMRLYGANRIDIERLINESN
jgi:hypothetical protein